MTENRLANTFAVLRAVVSTVTCKPGWSFSFRDDDDGFRLAILVQGEDSRKPGHRFNVVHLFPIPLATYTYNANSWTRWVFEQCRKVEDHELGEWFLVGGVRCFPPLHGPGDDPYVIRELCSAEDANTNQDGSIGRGAVGAAGGRA